VQADGFLYVSGQLPIDPKSGKLVEGGIAEQTKQAMENIAVILNAANYSFADVVQVTVYLASMADFEGFNQQYAKYFAEASFPARAALGAQLKAGAKVMVTAVAYKRRVSV
jgi:2-iminobutanoate/2-iminopropanoate deaminase